MSMHKKKYEKCSTEKCMSKFLAFIFVRINLEMKICCTFALEKPYCTLFSAVAVIF